MAVARVCRGVKRQGWYFSSGVGHSGCLADGICKGERRGPMREQEEVRSMACAHGGREERVAEGIPGMGKEWPQPGEGEGTEALGGNL